MADPDVRADHDVGIGHAGIGHAGIGHVGIGPDGRGDRPLSALPSRTARALAFIAILVGGFAGGLIGFALVDVQCTGDCDTAKALGAGIGAVFAAAGTAVVAILVLRAMGEWHEIQDRQQ